MGAATTLQGRGGGAGVIVQAGDVQSVSRQDPPRADVPQLEPLPERWLNATGSRCKKECEHATAWSTPRKKDEKEDPRIGKANRQFFQALERPSADRWPLTRSRPRGG